MAISTIQGGHNNNVLMFSNYQEDGHAVFYVRPFSERTKNDLDRLVVDAPRVSGSNTSIVEKNGAYRVSAKESIDSIDFMSSFWGILFRRFMAESKTVCVDPLTEEKYYGLIFSNEYIEPCARKLAV